MPKANVAVTRQQMQRYHLVLAAENKRHYAKIAKLANELAMIRHACKHPKTTYYPDAAGGSDSWYECDICGADVK